MTTRTSDDVLSTGQAAALLGTSVQHVIDLCARGELPYTMAGTHRRIRRADVEALRDRRAANRGGPLTDDQIRSLWLHRATAGPSPATPSDRLSDRVNGSRGCSSADPTANGGSASGSTSSTVGPRP